MNKRIQNKIEEAESFIAELEEIKPLNLEEYVALRQKSIF